MWQWFTIYAVWILIASAFVLVLVLVVQRQIRERIKKTAPKKWHHSLERGMRLAVWVTEAIALVIAALALAAIIMSREGVHAMVTPETIQKWFLGHGVPIFTIILFSYLLHRMSKVAIPQIVERTVRVRGRGRRAREELTKRSQTLSGILIQGIGAIIVIVALFMLLSEVGVNIAPLLAGAGVAGIAIGLGAQSLIKDVLNGLFILLEDQYNKGDWVRIGDVNGLVEQINLRRTVLRDLDGMVHSIPNGEVKIASNYTKEWARVNMDVSVAYGEDLDHVMEVINTVGNKLAEDDYFRPKIRTAPQVLRVNNFGDSGIEIRIVGETKPLMQWEVMGALRLRLKKAFDEEGIEIPWPHVKLYFGENQQVRNLVCQACLQPNAPGSKFCSQCGANLSSQ